MFTLQGPAPQQRRAVVGGSQIISRPGRHALARRTRSQLRLLYGISFQQFGTAHRGALVLPVPFLSAPDLVRPIARGRVASRLSIRPNPPFVYTHDGPGSPTVTVAHHEAALDARIQPESWLSIRVARRSAVAIPSFEQDPSHPHPHQLLLILADPSPLSFHHPSLLHQHQPPTAVPNRSTHLAPQSMRLEVLCGILETIQEMERQAQVPLHPPSSNRTR